MKPTAYKLERHAYILHQKSRVPHCLLSILVPLICFPSFLPSLLWPRLRPIPSLGKPRLSPSRRTQALHDFCTFRINRKIRCLFIRFRSRKWFINCLQSLQISQVGLQQHSPGQKCSHSVHSSPVLAFLLKWKF